MTFSTVILGVAFLPLFTMSGVSGVIFSPMAHTYAFAIGGAIVMALTLTLVLTTSAGAKTTAAQASARWERVRARTHPSARDSAASAYAADAVSPST